MGVQVPVAITWSSSKNKMECELKVSLCNNLHSFSYFLNRRRIIGGKFTCFHISQQTMAKNAEICRF